MNLLLYTSPSLLQAKISCLAIAISLGLFTLGAVLKKELGMAAVGFVLCGGVILFSSDIVEANKSLVVEECVCFYIAYVHSFGSIPIISLANLKAFISGFIRKRGEDRDTS